jgi:hypothetical protein
LAVRSFFWQIHQRTYIMTSDTLRKVLVAGVAVAALSFTVACKPKADATADSSAASAEAAASDATAAASTASMAASDAAASATAAAAPANK